MKKKRRKRGTGNQYFTKKTEDSIVAYAATEDINIRTKLYVEEIKPALKFGSLLYLVNTTNQRAQKLFHTSLW